MRLVTSLLFAVLAASPSLSHEFWIEPEVFQIEAGETLNANFRNGQEFKGGALSWFDRRTRRSEIHLNGNMTEYSGRDGDIPAVSFITSTQGLISFAHETTRNRISYEDAAKFDAFVTHKDLDTSAHPNPSYPITEGYVRYAKSLVAIGHGEGSDQSTGLEIEFVALKNPYSDDLTDGLSFQLLYQNQPRANAQVEVFERAPNDEVHIFLLRTDLNGEVTIPVKSGFDYLLDSVLLRSRPEDKINKDGMIWESIWASMTFTVPE
ncbi:MAG: DUF4198 domain-containing protein [Cognatishimia sp.]|uniref:DUF4198 domain-containing protein n=1 Tax=Cognatishimia sp. TaxID=2211648 RepID=UPI003B8E159F